MQLIKIILVAPATNAFSEKKLKKVKTSIRSTMTGSRVNYLLMINIYSRLSLSRTLKGPGDLFEIEKVRDIENLTK